MGTRSTIALEFADGTVEQVYCHWDGFLEHNGRTLQEHYSDPFKLQKLLALGGLSSLKEEIGVKHPFEAPGTYNSPGWLAHDAKFGKMCLFYARDRGEDLEINRFKDIFEYERDGQEEEYDYILKQENGKAVWRVRCYATNGNWVTLKEAAAMQVEEDFE